MAAAIILSNLKPQARPEAPLNPDRSALQDSQLLEIKGIFRGRELTRKDSRIPSHIAVLDNLVGGGIVRGRISEIVGGRSSGKTSLAAAFAASATGRGETIAWLDSSLSFDPESIAAAGADLARILWVSCGDPLRNRAARPAFYDSNDSGVRNRYPSAILKAAEWILAAGGFAMVVIDFGDSKRIPPQSAALRLARAAERSGAAILVLAANRICGTFAALSLVLNRNRACFSRSHAGAPALFDGLVIETRIARNKLGGSGGIATWTAMTDPSLAPAETNGAGAIYDRVRMAAVSR